MRRQARHLPGAYLWNPAFFIGLVLLFLNDQVLKWTFANTWTGKLSDLAGLLIFPLFLSFVWPRFWKWTPLLTAIGFIWWKSPYSEAFLSWYNQLAVIPLTRVVDYSDLWCLLVLPLSFLLLLRIRAAPILLLPPSRLPIMLVLTISIMVFMATSPPARYYYMMSNGDLHLYANYKVRMNKKEILEKLDQLDMEVRIDTALWQMEGKHAYPYPFPDSTIESCPYYRIEELVLGEDTLRHIQFALVRLSDNKTKIYLNGLVSGQDIPDWETEKEWRKYYRRILKRELVKSVK